MQGLPPEDSKEYTHFIPNLPKGCPEGAINNDVAYEIRSSTPLEESILLVNSLLSVVRDPIFFRINSSGYVVVEDYIGIPIGPHTESSVDDLLFQSESFRTLVHTTGHFDPSSFVPIHSLWRNSSGQDIFEKLGMSHLHQRTSNQPMVSHMHVTSTSYMVPLDHFTGTASNFVTFLDQLLVDSHTILPLQLASSTMVPQATHVSTRSVVITQAHIRTPLPLRPYLSLPPGYHALSTSIANPSQNSSRGPNILVSLGYNVASIFFPTPT